MADDTIAPLEHNNERGGFMKKPSDIEQILALSAIGWGSKKIAREIGLSRGTVRKYIKQGSWRPSLANKKSCLNGLEPWLKARLEQHKGNADVVRQELKSEHGIIVSLRTVQRSVQHWRLSEHAQLKATVRFETPPGKQLQIDFGSVTVSIGQERVRIHLFVATLGFSRRIYVAPYMHERHSAWFHGIENTFRHFDGITNEVLIDNARTLVDLHNVQTQELVFTNRFLAFSRYWGFIPKACAPYRPRTKGKDERAVSYVKHNAIAGHAFDSWEHLEMSLMKWNSSVADVRIHGTTKQVPLEHFEREEKAKLHPVNGRPPFLQIRELVRVVCSEACIDIDTNKYSVPWSLIGSQVLASVMDGEVKITHNGLEVACHQALRDKYGRSINPEHLKGIVGFRIYTPPKLVQTVPLIANTSTLIRPLQEYESVVGGGW